MKISNNCIAVLLLCLLSLCLIPYRLVAGDTVMSNAVKSLISRWLPKHAPFFEVIIDVDYKGEKDYFKIESRGKKIVLIGNNGVSAASAFKYYLNHYAHCDISWNGVNLNISAGKLPKVHIPIRKESPYKYRYYLNYCTFNYTMSWWDWDRWQKEIDWMAMHGINAPLALTGQNIIWDRVYKSLGFTDTDLKGFYSGPAYFNWFWMGNFDGYNGPLPYSFMEKHETLQKKILERERSFGMKPILPAFTGHVPANFKVRFPKAKLHRTNSGGGFADSYILSPEDSMFVKVGSLFTKELIRTFGTDHHYSADTFNENHPPSSDSLYLDGITKKVYAGMASIDPKAVWFMQGWLFHISPYFWKETQNKAVLNALPKGKMIILDLFAESYPVWKKTEAFYSTPWIWNMLHNFGGNISMFGRMESVAQDPIEALKDPNSGNMVGIGLTPEAIEQNPVMYALMMEHVWNDAPVNLDEWIPQYVYRRYGKKNIQVIKGWEILRRTVYQGGLTEGGPESIITGRPTFKASTTWTKTDLHYNSKDLIPAWDYFIQSADDLGKNDGFQYDLVDLTRQVLVNYANVLQQRAALDFERKDIINLKKHSSEFLTLIDDIDNLLASRSDFLLGRWLNAAKKMADNDEERKLYEKNARNLITTWGEKDSPLNDYACKQWAGMMKGYYKRRWKQFFSYAVRCLEENEAYDEDYIRTEISKSDWEWVNGIEEYSDAPQGNPVLLSKSLYRKYRNIVSQ